jgi:hypothetical protein
LPRAIRNAYADVDAFFVDLIAVFAQEIRRSGAAGCRRCIDEIAIALLSIPQSASGSAASAG